MNCQEFDEIWNELLDAETAARSRDDLADAVSRAALLGRAEAARRHARSCPRCREIGARNETLRRALQSWARRPVVSPAPELIDRIVSSARRPSWSKTPLRGAIPLAAALAVAASLFLAFGPIQWQAEHPRGGPAAERNEGTQGGAAGQPVRQADARFLSNALSRATEATWDLARTTSGPAARLGRQVLEAATQSDRQARPTPAAVADEESKSALAAIPSLLPDLPASPPGAALLQDVGDGLAASVRPLSATARQAFEFLRPPFFGKAGNPAASSAPKGA
ncbi:MAG: hypothetical protein ACP5XB_24690 [Isosphaeraceae bacterium]